MKKWSLQDPYSCNSVLFPLLSHFISVSFPLPFSLKVDIHWFRKLTLFLLLQSWNFDSQGYQNSMLRNIWSNDYYKLQNA